MSAGYAELWNPAGQGWLAAGWAFWRSIFWQQFQAAMLAFSRSFYYTLFAVRAARIGDGIGFHDFRQSDGE